MCRSRKIDAPTVRALRTGRAGATGCHLYPRGGRGLLVLHGHQWSVADESEESEAERSSAERAISDPARATAGSTAGAAPSRDRPASAARGSRVTPDERAAALSALARDELLEAEARFIARIITAGDEDSPVVCEAWAAALQNETFKFQHTLRVARASPPVPMHSIIMGMLRAAMPSELARRVDELIRLHRMTEM